MIYIKAILDMLGAVGLLKKILLALGLVTAAGIGYGVWHHKVFHEGYARALSDIAAEDSAAIKRATDLRSTWRGCRDRGGRWDQAAGRCAS